MDESPLESAQKPTSEWQDPAPPLGPTRSHNRHELEPKRRQYQSCDYCRKRRRACNAVRLGINPHAQGQAAVKNMACSACHRANKSCTFNWLLDLPKGRPQSVKLLSTTHDYKLATSPDETSAHKEARHSNLAVADENPKHPLSPSSPVKPSASILKSLSGPSPDNAYWRPRHGATSPSKGNFSKARDHSISTMSDEYDLIEPGIEDVGVLPAKSWDSHSASIYERPLAMHLAQLAEDAAAPWTSTHFPCTPISDDDPEQTRMLPTSVVDESNKEFEQPRRHPAHRSRTCYKGEREDRLRIQGAVDTIQASMQTIRHRNNNELILSESKIAETSIRSFFIAGLKQIYENSMEASVACWVTDQNSPYERRLSKSRWPTSSTTTSDTLTTSLVERAHRLDNALSVLRPKPLSSAENAAASEVLQLAVLAFASQWSSSSPTQARWKDGISGSDEHDTGATFLPDSGDLEYLIRQSLWTQLNSCLARLSDCDLFRVITAKLILFFVSRPLNREEKDLMEYILSSELLPPDLQSTRLSDRYRHNIPIDPNTPIQEHSAGRTQDTRTLFDLLGAESRTDHLRSAMHHLSTWSRRIKQFLQRTKVKSRAGEVHPFGQIRQKVLEACSHFNLLFWFAIMLDTARSTLHRRELVFLDDETESCIIRHSSEETSAYTDGTIKETAYPNALSPIPSGHLVSEIWGPLLSKPSAPCDNPFKDLRSNFINRMSLVLQEATPMTVLIIRKVAHLQAAIAAKHTVEEIEHCIAEILTVCGNWDLRYLQFFNNCMAEHSMLPFKIRSWYLMILAHWLCGYLRGLEIIDEYDMQSHSTSMQRAVRLSTSLVPRLQKEGSYKLAQLVQISRLDGTTNAVDQTNREYHSTIRPGSLLTEPGPDIMIFGLKSACDVMLVWLHILQATPVVADVRNMWVRCNTNVDELVGHIVGCIDAMTQLGRLSCFAEINAKIYQKLLGALMREMNVVGNRAELAKPSYVL